ncbi:hypothetical protein ONA91_32505 [Micromonospora sp. DR5-3]|uniref:hypothetical protein n=1 Tax=unclassified Micromonospora TaxID=2617518 RepID=UPI0011D8314E|nr:MULTISPECIES: hypothetical protein [unclassified Micromonospora]MCW3819173.1 hypothetical protein [Micromonospora sp. DR5-3]TYC21082.1 hypothetical protein FXF52_27805 [Micromonospora sp. MP36]
MRRLVTALLCLAALLSCAKPGDASSPAGSAEGSSWGTYQADVTAVRVSDDPRSLVLTLALLGDADGCSRDPRITYFVEENNRIYANVVQDSRLSGVVGACPTHTSGEVTLTAPGPIDGRIVVLNQEPWKRDGENYRRCDPTFGCDPMPADHCARAWIDVAVRGIDVSRHSVGSPEGCDGTWLVMTVPFDPVPCGAEARPGCNPSVNVRRYFLRWAGQQGWATIASSTEAGCGRVLTVQPAFPRKLCADLPRP